MYDLIISGGTVVTESGVRHGDLAVTDGKVAAILPRRHGAEAREVADARGCYVLPGLIDPHVHLNLGPPAEEQYRETATAAMGGVTTVMHMLQTTRPYEEIFEHERQQGEREAYVDFGYHFVLLTAEQVQAIPRYVTEFGVTSFKHMMHIKGAEGRYLGIEQGTDDGHFYAILKTLGRFPHTVLAVHPENIEIIWRVQEEIKATQRVDLAAYTEARPAVAEAIAIEMTMALSRATGGAVYIVHLSSGLGLEAYKRQQAITERAFLETCPQYLTHTMDSELGVIGKVNPPLRTAADNEALWGAILDGTIDTIGSDHVPRRLERKQGTIWQASAGYPGIATILPVLVSEGVHKRSLPWERLVQITSTNTARVFGLYPQKGSLQPGADADVVVVDPEREHTITAGELQSFSDYSIYDGWKVKGWPVATYVRGELVMREGELVGRAGHGRFLARSAFTQV